MRAIALMPLVLAVGACKQPPPEAPKELVDLSFYLFAEFEADDDVVVAGMQNLQDYLKGEDLEADVKDRAFTLPILDGKNLGGLSIPQGVNAEDQIPIGLPGLSKHKMTDQVDLFVEPNQVCIESATTVWAKREFLEGKSCFAKGDCDRLDIVQEVRKENILAKVWYDQYKSYRRVILDNGDEAFVARSWIEEQYPADGGKNSWDQLFHLDVYLPGKGGDTLRYFAMWSSVVLGGVNDDSYANLVRDGVDESMIFSDEFIAGKIDSCKNDRNADKPDR
ncbi:MAG: hypothetical protein ACI8PZ_001454 [Myxococcota bacterium]|jgi:hypothetical protein